jgi:thymidine kinase
VIRQDPDGNIITAGESIEIGGDDRYVSMCRKHFYEAFETNDR